MYGWWIIEVYEKLGVTKLAFVMLTREMVDIIDGEGTQDDV